MFTLRKISFIFFLFLLTLSPVQAVVVTLNSASGDFDGLLLEASASANVGVILFHGRGQNYNSDVVRQLRTSLNSNGYTTLSIENPEPAGGTGFTDYTTAEDIIDDQVFDYVTASVNELIARNNSIDTIVLGGFSLGSRFATAAAAAWSQGFLNSLTPGVNLGGLIGVGMYTGLNGSTPSQTPATAADDINVYDTINNLSLIDSNVSVLDLYGDRDSSAAVTAAARSNAAVLLDYTQQSLTCPDFNNGTYYARNRGGSQIVPYTENRCHQLRNGFLSVDNAANNNPDVILRGYADAPLETTVNTWMATHVPLTTVPNPASIWLFVLGLFSLAGLNRQSR